MNPETERSREVVDTGLKTHHQFPAEAKELWLLHDQTEKATGLEEVALAKKAADKSK